MSIFTENAETIFNPVTGGGAPRGTDMGQVQTWGMEVEYLANLAFTSSLVYSLRSDLYANLVPAANVPALVIGDPTAGYDGLYMKVGATTTGSWTRLGDVPGRQFISAVDAGAGTANAIVATSAIPLPAADGGALISLNIFETTTATPVTVAFNGGSALTIKTVTGGNPAVGGLTAGMYVLGVVSGSTFRLMSDQASSAILAAAAAAQAAAEAAAASVIIKDFATVAAAESGVFASIPAFLRVAGYTDAGDGGHGLFSDPVAVEPTYEPKLFISNVNRWFTGSETVMDIMRFGARRLGAGTAGAILSNDTAFADAKDWLHGRLVGGALPELQFGPGVYDFSTFPNFAKNGARVIGLGNCVLRFHGSGTAVTLDGLAVDGVTDGEWNTTFTNFIIETPAAAAGDGILLRALHESVVVVDVRSAGSSSAGMRIQWCVTSRIYLRCSGNKYGWYDSAEPLYGLYVENHPTYTGYTAASFCHIFADIAGPDYGAFLHEANGVMLTGTFQSAGVTGVTFDAGALDCVLWNADMEANTTFDAYILGHRNIIRDCQSSTGVTIDGSAEGNRIDGGTHQIIQLTGSTVGNTVNTNYNRTGSASLTDSGSKNSIRAYDITNNVWWNPTPVAVTFAGAWVNYGGTRPNVTYYKDADGYVHLIGTTKGGTVGTPITTLPAGFRPAALTQIFTSASFVDGLLNLVTVDSAGVVLHEAGTNTAVTLDIVFLAA